MITVSSNVYTLRNHRDLYGINRLLSESMERLSSGLRINRGADDPSGLAISRGFHTKFRGLSVATENIQDGLKWLQARDRSMQLQYDLLMRMRDLALRASNEAVLTTADYTRLNNEYATLRDELTRAAKAASLNEKETLFHPGKLDVVWVADQTASMGTHLNNLASAASSMFLGFAQKKYDLRMAVVGMGSANNVADVKDFPNPDNPITNLGLASFVNTIEPVGGTRFWDNASEFTQDVNEINTGAGFAERGLDSVYEASELLTVGAAGGATNFRADAQKIFVLITDEDSDDAGTDQTVDDGFGVPTPYYDVPTELEQQLITRLDSLDATLFMAANIQASGAYQAYLGSDWQNWDDDYVNVVNATGGTSVYLTEDPPASTTWVDEVVEALEAYGGDWDKNFYVGDDGNQAIHRLEFTFESVSADCLNSVDKTSISNLTNAQVAVTAVNGAIDDLSEAISNTGILELRFQHIIDEIQKEYINVRAANSKIEDADMAAEISRLTKNQILQQGSLAASAYANSMPAAALTLLSQNGIGSRGAF